MGNLRIGWLAVGALALAIVVVVVLVYTRYRHDLRGARERLKSGSSQVIETGCGPIEYATFGQGAPVLVVHGILGGFDQGLVIARGNVGEGFRSSLNSMMGVPKGFEFTPKYKADVAQVMTTILPVNPRADGAVFDMFVSNVDINPGCFAESAAIIAATMRALN